MIDYAVQCQSVYEFLCISIWIGASGLGPGAWCSVARKAK